MVGVFFFFFINLVDVDWKAVSDIGIKQVESNPIELTTYNRPPGRFVEPDRHRRPGDRYFCQEFSSSQIRDGGFLFPLPHPSPLMSEWSKDIKSYPPDQYDGRGIFCPFLGRKAAV